MRKRDGTLQQTLSTRGQLLLRGPAQQRLNFSSSGKLPIPERRSFLSRQSPAAVRQSHSHHATSESSSSTMYGPALSRSHRSRNISPFLTLPSDITISPEPASTKREHELGMYAALRAHHGREHFDSAALREGAIQWLSLRSTEIQRDDGVASASRAVQMLGLERVTDLPPLALQLGGTQHNLNCLVDEVNDAINSKSWRELWVIFKQLGAWHSLMHEPAAERPWWMLQAVSEREGVAEMVDLTSGAEPGGADAPIELNEIDSSPAAKKLRSASSCCIHDGVEE